MYLSRENAPVLVLVRLMVSRRALAAAIYTNSVPQNKR